MGIVYEDEYEGFSEDYFLRTLKRSLCSFV